MGPWTFSEKARSEFTNMRLFPPVVGVFQDLRIAATLVRDESHRTRGELLLANGALDNTTWHKVAGEVGAFTIGSAGVGSGANGWSAEAAITRDILGQLVASGTVKALVESGSDAGFSLGDDFVRLAIEDPGAGGDRVPTLNGIPLEEVSYP